MTESVTVADIICLRVGIETQLKYAAKRLEQVEKELAAIDVLIEKFRADEEEMAWYD